MQRNFKVKKKSPCDRTRLPLVALFGRGTCCCHHILLYGYII